MGNCASQNLDIPLATANIVFVLGGPGSGKGTQCEKIAKQFAFKHLSTGDLFRAEVAEKSEVGLQCEAIMKSGGLIPVEITVTVLKNAIEKSMRLEGCNSFLIDGFPREASQVTAFQKKFGRDCNFVLFFDVSDEEMTARLLKRAETSGRADDNLETIKTRLATFRRQTVPVVEIYEPKNKLKKVPANRSVDEVWNDTREIFVTEVLKKIPIVFVLGGPGSGKGTQCERIAETYKYKHLSTGDLLRAEVASGSETGKTCGEIMKSGGLVPVETTITILYNAVKKALQTEKCNGVLVDGFPREEVQIAAFEKKFQRDCNFVLYFECSDAEMTKRIMKRGETSGRADDNAEAVVKRIQTFKDQTMPAVNHYSALGAIRKVNAEQSVEDVTRHVRAIFGTQP